MLSAFLCMLAGIPSTPYQENSKILDGDSLEVADSILFDSILASLDTVPTSFDSLFTDTTLSNGARQAAAALKRDTTEDSYNKLSEKVAKGGSPPKYEPQPEVVTEEKPVKRGLFGFRKK